MRFYPYRGPRAKIRIGSDLGHYSYNSPSIIKYHVPLTGDMFTARYADSSFDEDHFPALGGESNHKECQEIDWNVTGIQSLDPRTKESETEVQRIIDLQHIANNLPDAFTDHKGVTKSHIPAVNAPERVEVPTKTTQTPNESKRGRNLVSRNIASQKPPRKQRKPNPLPVNAIQPQVEGHQPDAQHLEPSINAHKNIIAGTSEHHDSIVVGNHIESEGIKEISINYIESGESYNRETTIVDIYFASEIVETLQLDPEPKTVRECLKRPDWPK